MTGYPLIISSHPAENDGEPQKSGAFFQKCTIIIPLNLRVSTYFLENIETRLNHIHPSATAWPEAQSKTIFFPDTS